MLLFSKTSLTAGDIITDAAALVKDTTNDIWTDAEKLYALKQACKKTYPDIFVPVADTSLTTNGTSYSFTIPATISIIQAVKILPDVSSEYEDVSFHTESTASGNTLFLQELFESGHTLKIIGGKRITIPVTTATPMDFPIEAEDLLVLGIKIELYEMLLIDKAKMNQFAAREQEITEVDVLNILSSMKKDYYARKQEINSLLIMQITRI